MFLALAAIGLASCNGGFKKGDGGLLYNIHTDKSGTPAAIGDFMSLNLVAKNDADSVLFSTYDSGHPQFLLLQAPQTKGDVFSGIALLSEGDSATIKISIDSLFKGKQKPPGLKGKYLIYNVKVEKVIAKGKQTDQVFQGIVTAYVKKEADAVKDQEPKDIQKYITDSKLNFTKTASGLYYFVSKPGTGALPAVGDSVSVDYIGKFIGGKVFDTSIKAEAEKAKILNPMQPYQPIKIAVGTHGVIPGWDEALLLFNKGSKVTVIVPSSLAYGPQGNPPTINPYTPLVFEMEIMDIKHPSAAAPVAKNK